MCSVYFCFLFFFFFQAEDGIRDLYVTGVQTCALPILMETGASRYPSPAVSSSAQDRPLLLGCPRPHYSCPGFPFPRCPPPQRETQCWLPDRSRRTTGRVLRALPLLRHPPRPTDEPPRPTPHRHPAL